MQCLKAWGCKGGIILKGKLYVFAVLLLMALYFVGCAGNDNSYDVNDKDNNLISDNSSSKLSGDYDVGYSPSESSSYSGSSYKTIEHYCDADACYKEGTKTITGISGATEYYCQEHYDEIQGIISDMEKDVGNGTASKHQCEACSKEGTHELIGFSGATEYYCTEHYNEIIEILNKMYEDYDNQRGG